MRRSSGGEWGGASASRGDPVRRSIARLAMAVAATEERAAPFVISGAVELLDTLGFGAVSVVVARELESGESIDVVAECDVIRPLGIAVALPVAAALAEMVTTKSGISDERLDVLREITARLSSIPISIRRAPAVAAAR